MNILLLGGTGAMGKSIASLLSRKGVKVTITSRSERLNDDMVEYIKGDAHELCFLNSVLDMKSWDTIIDFMVYSTDEFKERVGDLLSKTNQYIFISSARVYSNTCGKIVETSSLLLESSCDILFLSSDEYPLTKARQESILKNCGYDNWTIIRPYITYASERFQLGVFEKEEWLYRALMGKKIVMPEPLMDKETTLTSGEDVAEGIISIINKKDAIGQIFHITNQDTITWKEVLDIYLNTFETIVGYKPEVKYQKLNDFYKYNSKYPIEYDRLYNRKFDNSKINQFIDVGKFINPSDGLKENLSEFLKLSRFDKINWKLEAYKDKYTGDFTKLNQIDGVKNKLKYITFRIFG